MGNFKNLKITIGLASEVILNRYTTIDSILMSIYYNILRSRGKQEEFVDGVDNITFIDKKNNVLSGSIWYINKDKKIKHSFISYYKKSETRKMQEYLQSKSQKNETSGLFKNAMLTDEVLLVDEVYFYIRGDKEKIESLLMNKSYGLKYLGKKSSLGYGKVNAVFVEEIKEDKGHSIFKNTVSKPLPYKDFCDEVKSKKVAYYRGIPPYWMQTDREPCFMPTTSLYELEDKSATNSNFKSVIPTEYMSPIRFVRSVLDKEFEPINLLADGRKNRWFIYDSTDNNGEQKLCRFSHTYESRGIVGDMASFLKVKKDSFTDHAFGNRSDFIGEDFLWATELEQLRTIPMTLFQEEEAYKVYYDSSTKEGFKLFELISDVGIFKPPFFLGFKTTSNSQHIIFKGSVSISSALMTIQYGNETLFIDSELLQDAVKDIKEILEDKSLGISKAHLCGNFSSGEHYSLKKEHKNEKNEKVIEDFQKKYNADIRMLLSISSKT